jgi:hypothetical protein
MANRGVSKYERNVSDGFLITPGSGDHVTISGGTFVYKGTSYTVNTETDLALTAPITGGNLRRNYIYIECSSVPTVTISAYATAEGAAVTALDTKYLLADSTNTDGGSQNHYTRLYIGYVDVDDDGTTAAGDITMWQPVVERGA